MTDKPELMSNSAACHCLHSEQLTVPVVLRVDMNGTLISINWQLFHLLITTVTCKNVNGNALTNMD